ncbi:MAG TPA: hypothetical protein VG965_07320 [Patescibacteria group bacterium]|nr:hypothetical protein [Patescibacteria group bacterium]
MKELLSLSIPQGADSTPVQIQTPADIPSGVSLGALVTTLLQAAMVFGILMSLGFFVYGGLHWVQSRGDKESLNKSRRILIYAVFGLIVMSLALVIVNVITSALGVQNLISGN